MIEYIICPVCQSETTSLVECPTCEIEMCRGCKDDHDCQGLDLD